jgi:hypothetical protein
VDNRFVQGTLALNRTELRRYLARVSDRWQLDGAFLGGSALSSVGDHGLPAELAPRFTLVLVTDSFDAVPWLERVRVAASLWDAGEMGAGVEPHCYTRTEFERKRDSVPAVRDAVWHGLDLLVFI